MYISLFVTLFMSLNPALSIPFESGFGPSDDIFSLPEDSDFFDTNTFLEPGSPDISLTSSVDKLADLFSPSSFFADDSGNEYDDIQLLLSSDTDAFCPLGRRKRDSSGSCGWSEAPASQAPLPNLVLPSVIDLDLNPGAGGSSEGAGTATGDFGGDPCIAQVGYPVHVCCRGPPGAHVGIIYSTIENCRLGKLFLIVSFPSARTITAVSKPCHTRRLLSFLFLAETNLLSFDPFQISPLALLSFKKIPPEKKSNDFRLPLIPQMRHPNQRLLSKVLCKCLPPSLRPAYLFFLSSISHVK